MITYLAHGYTYSTLRERMLDALVADPINKHSIYSREAAEDYRRVLDKGLVSMNTEDMLFEYII